MKMLVFSDSHGFTATMIEAIYDNEPDCVVFLGDIHADCNVLSRYFPTMTICEVIGNNDWNHELRTETAAEFGGVKFFITHGHKYGVKETLSRLALAAQEKSADIVLFGHTHNPEEIYLPRGDTRFGFEVKKDMYFMNPGSIGTYCASFGSIEFDKSGAVITNPYVKLQTTEVSVYCPVYTYKEVPLTVSYKYNYYNASNVTITINPAAITIKGDPDELDRINSVSLTQLDEKKITGDLTQTATIVLPDGIDNVSGVSTATVSIVHKGTETRDLVVSNIVVTNPNNLNYSLDTASLTVKFRGAYSKLQMLSQSNIVANVDISYLTNSSGTVEVPVTFTIADALSASVYEIGEYKITVTITK